MSFSCLTCQVLKRTKSDLGVDRDRAMEINYSYEKLSRARRVHDQRTWSRNLAAPTGRDPMKGGPAAVWTQKNKASRLGHRWMLSAGALALEGDAEPRLVRSPGMRRDWSFENLVERG